MIAHGAGIIHRYTDIPQDSAEQIAYHLAQSMIKYWGGSMLYVPRQMATTLHERDLAIWQDFNGRNHNELARKYGLSVITIYQIIAKIRKELPATQPDLFDSQ